MHQELWRHSLHWSKHALNIIQTSNFILKQEHNKYCKIYINQKEINYSSTSCKVSSEASKSKLSMFYFFCSYFVLPVILCKLFVLKGSPHSILITFQSVLLPPTKSQTRRNVFNSPISFHLSHLFKKNFLKLWIKGNIFWNFLNDSED